jgi:hypothetical protein
MEQYENSPLITASTHEEASRLMDPLCDLFECAEKENLLKNLPFEVLITLFSGAVISLAKLYKADNVNLDEQLMSTAINAIWDMIKA